MPDSPKRSTRLTGSEQEELKRLVLDPLHAATECKDDRTRLLATLAVNHNLNYLRRRNVENWLRPLVPEVGEASGREFWNRIWAKVRRDPNLQMPRAEFDALDEMELHALLSSGNPATLKETAAGKPSPRAMPAPSDPFDSRDKREAAYKAAKAEAGRAKQLAADIGVEYTDLRKWVRVRKLAKGKSDKTNRIEEFLPRYVSAM